MSNALLRGHDDSIVQKFEDSLAQDSQARVICSKEKRDLITMLLLRLTQRCRSSSGKSESKCAEWLVGCPLSVGEKTQSGMLMKIARLHR